MFSIGPLALPGAVPELGASVRTADDPVGRLHGSAGPAVLGPRLEVHRAAADTLVLPSPPAMVKASAPPHPLWQQPVPPPVPVAAPPPAPQATVPPVAQPLPRVAPSPLASATPVKPAPTLMPAVVPSPSPAPTPSPPPTPTPAPLTDRLTSSDRTLNVPVGIYDDCTGQTPLPYDHAALDPCMRYLRYFVGHNPGVFAPLIHMGPGFVLTWWDHSGAAHAYRIISRRDMAADAPRTPTGDSVVAQFQTCITYDGSVDRIFDAVAA